MYFLGKPAPSFNGLIEVDKQVSVTYNCIMLSVVNSVYDFSLLQTKLDHFYYFICSISICIREYFHHVIGNLEIIHIAYSHASSHLTIYTQQKHFVIGDTSLNILIPHWLNDSSPLDNPKNSKLDINSYKV